MKTTAKRVLSMFMCILMVFSTAAFTVASAADSTNTKEYTYNAKHYLDTTDTQNAKAALDAVDALLKDLNIKETVNLGLKKLTVDFTSINAAFKTVDDLKGLINSVKAFLGDLKDLNLKNWKTGLKRPKDDLKMINQLLQLLADNTKIIGKIVDGSLDGGLLLNSFIDFKTIFGADGIYGLIKKELVKLVYSDENSAEFKTAYAKKLDNFVYEDVLALVNKADGALPGFKMNSKSTVDNILLSLFASAWTKYIVPAIKSISVDWSKSDNAALKKLSSVLCLDGSKFNENSVKIDTSKSFESQINNIVGAVVKFFYPAAKWTSASDTSKISSNINNVYKALAKDLGLKDSKPLTIVKYVVSNLEIDGMDEYVGDVSKWTSVKQAAALVLTNTAKKNNIPVKASTNYETILGDMLVYALKDVVNPGYTAGAGKSVWTVANDILNVFLFDKGFAKVLALPSSITAKSTVFQKMDAIIDKTQIFKGLKPEENYKTETFLKGLIDAIFNLDIAKAVDMTAVTFLGDFGKKNAVEVLYKTIYTTLKNVMGKEIIVAYKAGTPLDTAISNTSLKTTVTNVLSSVNSKKATLLPPVLYLANAILSAGKEVAFTISDKLTIANAIYTGKDTYPQTIKVKGLTLKYGEDFAVEASGSKNLGTVKNAVIKFFGDVTGPDATKKSYKIVLGAPSSVKVTSKDTSATVTWGKVTGAKSYKVYYSTDNKNWTAKDTSKNSITLSKLTANKTYYVKVKAVNGSSLSDYSSTVKFATTVAKVTGVKVTQTSTTLTVKWNKVSGATSYVVSYSTDNKKWKTVTAKSTSAKISKLKANTTYYVKVKALKSKTAGPDSSTVKVKTAVAAPTGLKASKIKATSATVSWKKVSGAAGYIVYRDGKQVAKTNAKTVTYTDKKLKKNTSYKFTVKAYTVVSKKNVLSDSSAALKVKTAKK